MRPLVPGPTPQAHNGDIPGREQEALDPRNQGLWYSYALAPCPDVQAGMLPTGRRR